MPHISKRKLDKQTYELIADALTSLLSNLSQNEIKMVLSTLLSDTEKLMLAKRVATAFLVNEKVPESKIAEVLKLTRFTVSRFMLLMRVGPSESWEFIFNKLEKWHKFFTMKQVLKEAGIAAIKTFSRGLAGKV